MNEIEKNNQIVAQDAQQSLIQDACTIIDQAQETAYRQVNETLIKRNWLLGMRIQHEVLKDKRAEYGKQVVKCLAQSLVERISNSKFIPLRSFLQLPSGYFLRSE